MKFNVNGNTKELVAKEWQANTPFEQMSDYTEVFLSDFLIGRKKDMIHRRYKVGVEIFAKMAELVDLNNENSRLHAELSKEQLSTYEDWEMTRCVADVETMTKKENVFLKELSHQ